VKLDAALREVHDAERELARDLLRAGERHKADHDVFHVTRTLSTWCGRHLERLAAHGERYGVALDPSPPGAGLLGGLDVRRGDPGLLLLRDLRDLHLAAARASVAWTVLGQGAQAVRDTDLLATVTASHPETVRTMKWTVQKLKEASPQVLAS
jgi:hypothetical protein